MMAALCTVKVEVEPVVNQDVKEIIRTILDQNSMILQQNAYLLEFLRRPFIFKNPSEDEPSHDPE